MTLLAFAGATGCTEDRCADDPRGLLDDTTLFRGCSGDTLKFRPESFAIGDSRDAKDAGAGRDGGALDDFSSELGAVFVSSGLGATRSHAHFYIFECDKTTGESRRSGLIQLEPVDATCQVTSTEVLSCNTNDVGYANFRVRREGSGAGNAAICASRYATINLDDKKATISAAISVTSNNPEVAALEFDFASSAERTSGGSMRSPVWTLPARLTCVPAPQAVDCSGVMDRALSFSARALGAAAHDGGIAPIVVPRSSVPVTFTLTVDEGDGWLSVDTCDGLKQASVHGVIAAGTESTQLLRVCSGPGGGKFRISALVEGDQRATAPATVIFEPDHYAVVFSPAKVDSHVDSGLEKVQFDAHLESPCGGSLDGVKVTVRPADTSAGTPPVTLSSGDPSTVSTRSSSRTSLSVVATRTADSTCTANLTVAGVSP